MDIELLRDLTEASGVPGYEDRIREIVKRELDSAADRIRTDAMGNVVGTVDRPGEYAVVVAAHMDEIGFMVRHVRDDGFLELDALGGWDPRVLRAQRVTVHTDDGDLPGVIGSPPPHTMDESADEEPTKVDDMYVDLGLPADDVSKRVMIGDRVSMNAKTSRLGDLVSGKALDDRVSVFAMLSAAQRTDPEVTVHFAATVQEEVGLRGARALGVDIDADLAIALDVTVANDIPHVEDEGEYVTTLGDGAAVKIKDGSVITSPRVTRRLRETAESESIPYQLEILPRGGTDTAGFQTEGGAKPVGAISIPTRYLHTVTESAHVEDITAAIDLLVAFLETETGDHDYTL